MKRGLLALCTVLLALVAWVAFDNLADGVATDAVQVPQPASAEWVAHGAYLARAGNCVSCHTAPGEAPYAGGRALSTPFGTVYASNLTADAATGLGTWNAQHFWRALHHGRSKDGRLLAPVFPYNHTSLITRADSDALFAFFQSLAPVVRATPAHELRWPFGTQAALAVWRSLYFKPATFHADAQQSPEWNRGAYLLQGLGHCAACHSARDALGASGALDDLSGGVMPGVNWYAPSLLSVTETDLAHTPPAEIVRLLKTGQTSHAWVSGPMGEVVQNSTQYLRDDDLHAIATYLQSRAQQDLRATREPDSPAPSRKASARSVANGATVYKDHCAECHGEQGQGKAEAYPALAGNRAVQMRNITNLVQTLTYGGFSAATQAQPRPYGMPPFVLTLSDSDMADVLTHIRQQWGNTGAAVTEFDVGRVRVLQAH